MFLIRKLLKRFFCRHGLEDRATVPNAWGPALIVRTCISCGRQRYFEFIEAKCD